MRFIAMLLLAEKIPIDITARITGKSIRTIERWVSAY